MTSYIVTFEVAKAEVKTALKDLLKSYGSYCPINETSWAIKTDKTATQVRDHLIPAIETGDRLFVIRSGTEAAWRNSYGDKFTDWLKKNL